VRDFVMITEETVFNKIMYVSNSLIILRRNLSGSSIDERNDD